jgi:hypothetical protein
MFQLVRAIVTSALFYMKFTVVSSELDMKTWNFELTYMFIFYQIFLKTIQLLENVFIP